MTRRFQQLQPEERVMLQALKEQGRFTMLHRAAVPGTAIYQFCRN
ncbi:hypothetical protein [Paracidovorax anthurii]|nr:hypothetical protein [Paracidovorax anthurii]